MYHCFLFSLHDRPRDKLVALHGQHYCPAYEHYNHREQDKPQLGGNDSGNDSDKVTNVSCDNCKTDRLRECFGVKGGQVDVCIPCVRKIRAMYSVTKTSADSSDSSASAITAEENEERKDMYDIPRALSARMPDDYDKYCDTRMRQTMFY